MRVTRKLPSGLKINLTTARQRIKEIGKRVTEKLRRQNRQAFARGGHAHHGGKQWKGLAKSTIASKGHGKILIDGTQKNSMNMRRRQSVLGKFRIVGGSVVAEIRGINSADYAHFHQFGFVHKKAGWIAPRAPIVFSQSDAREIDAALNIFAGGGGKMKRRKRPPGRR